MKQIALFILLILLNSCTPFGKTDVMNYKDELSYLVSKLEEYPQGIYDRDDIDELIIADVRSLNIDLIVKNIKKGNGPYFGFEENDSLIIFINKSENIFGSEKRIIYDFSKEPRNFGDANNSAAAYRITQVDERWYYSEQGFD